WLRQMDRHRAEIAELFQKTYGADYKKWIQYWRIFFLAVAEFFGTDNGSQWMVSHYRFEKPVDA
ncbi:MAG: SAM-dependent methyltransferase, partial [Leptospiraceae bacterium]|nr:SAM-dependent methyltransferase [Leptospiraceae bacterium]